MTYAIPMKKVGTTNDSAEYALDDVALFRDLVGVAEQVSDGHFTVMRFTTNWRVGFCTPEDREEISRMWEGRTFAEAALRALWAHGQYAMQSKDHIPFARTPK